MKLKFSFARSWNELSDRQLLDYTELIMLKGLTGVRFDYELLKVLLGYRWYKLRLRRKLLILMSQVSLDTIKSNYSHLYSTQNLTRFLRRVKVRGEYYYGPGDRLSNLSIGEYAMAEDLFLSYLRSKKSDNQEHALDFLRYLMALLYVRESTAKRPFFERDMLPEKAANFGKVPEKHLYCCLLSYIGCRNYLASLPKYKAIYNGGTDAKMAGKKVPNSSRIGDLILKMSGGTFGNHEKTFSTNIYVFLDNYAEKLKENETNIS